MSAAHTSSEALSPWGMPQAHAAEVMALKKLFDARLAIPGSKSFTNRALLVAAAAAGVSRLASPLFSDDSYWCADALQKLGVSVASDRAGDAITVMGTGRFTMRDPSDPPYIGSAGTIARFLPGLLAARGDGDIVLTSSGQLARRPVAEMIDAIRQLGAEIEFPGGASFPMHIRGGSLAGGTATVSGRTSSQFVSGVLLAAPLAKNPVTVHVAGGIVQEDYVRMTLQLMAQFGVRVDARDDLQEFHVKPQDYIAGEKVIEADASTATYFLALAAATGGRVTLTNLDPNTLQPDFAFVHHLETMGCTVTQSGGDLTLQGPKKLKGGQVFDFNACSDSTPALAGILPFADAPVAVRGIAHIRKHESDRIAVICRTLESAGMRVEEYDDGFKVAQGALRHVTVDPHDDHRMAMGFAVMGAAGAGVKILDPACVSKTCPDFFGLLARAGVACRVT